MEKTEFDYCLTTETNPCGQGLKCKSLIEAYTTNFVNPPVSDTYGGTPAAWWGQQGPPPGWFSSPDGICILPDYDKTTDPPLSGRQYLNGKFLTTRYPLNDIVNGDPTNETKNALRGAIPIIIGCDQQFCGAASKEIPNGTYKLIDILEPSNLKNIYEWNEAPWAISGARKVAQGFATLGGTIVLRWPDDKVRNTLFGGKPLWNQMIYTLGSSPTEGIEAGDRTIDESWEFDGWFIDSKAIPMLQYYNPKIDFSPNSPDLKKFVISLRIGARTEEEIRNITTEPYIKLDGSVAYIYRPFRILPKFKYPASGNSVPGTSTPQGGTPSESDLVDMDSLSKFAESLKSPIKSSTGGSGLAARMNAEFNNVQEFATALSTGVQEEIDTKLIPIQNQIQQIGEKLAELGIAINDINNQPPVTVVVQPSPTPSITPSSQNGGTPETSPIPVPTPTPTPSPSPLQYLKDKVIGISVEPLAVLSTLGEITGAGLYLTGDQATLRVASLPTGYTLDGWYNAAGQRVSTTQEYSFTVQGSENFVLKFTEIDTRVTVTIKWNGSTSSARQENGEFIRRASIARQNGSVLAEGDITFATNSSPGQYPTSLSAKIEPGSQVVLRIPGLYSITFGAPIWRREGNNEILDRDIDFRPTVGSQDVTYVHTWVGN